MAAENRRTGQLDLPVSVLAYTGRTIFLIYFIFNLQVPRGE
jgi:hypothetical protein